MRTLKKKVDNKCQADKNLTTDLQNNEIWLWYGYPLRPEVTNQMMQWWLSSSGTYMFCITSHASFVTSFPLSRAWPIISACNFASLHCWQTTADNWILWQFSPLGQLGPSSQCFICCAVNVMGPYECKIYGNIRWPCISKMNWNGPQLITDSKLFNVLVKLISNCIHVHSFLLIRVADL